MAKEIQTAYTSTGANLYALVVSSVGTFWNGATLVSYVTADLGTYDIPLTEQGTASQIYMADMPAVAAGAYGILVYERAGGSPAEGDTLIAAGTIEWDGTVVVSRYSRLAPTTAGRTLDVTATGAAGIDWANVENPTTSLDLSATTISTSQIVASVTGSVGGTLANLASGAKTDVENAVWDAVIASHLTGGSTGSSLNAAGSAGDPWATTLPGAYSSGTAGFIVGTNLDATVTSRLASVSYTAPDNTTIGTISTNVTAVLADTDDIQTRLPAALVSGRMDVSIGAYQSGLTPLQPTVAGRTLDVTATGTAGIDWGNVENQSTTVGLSGTTVAAVTTITGLGSIVGLIAGKQIVPYEFSPGTTSQSIFVDIRDATTGAGATGLTAASTGATAAYTRENGTASPFTLVDLAAVDSAYTLGGFKELNSVTMPGRYRVDVPNPVLATGADFANVAISFTGTLTTDTLILLRQSVSAVGSGSTEYTVQIVDGNSDPIPSASVWLSTNEDGSNVVAGALSTDAFGNVTFLVDVGSYYLWAQAERYTGSNPTLVVVS